ncbi:TISB protein, partial [Nothocercus julius]|nr:TISB protein [Nothocercus julius]
MSTTLLSAFYDIDFLCKTEKSLSSLSSMLDKKAVGTPVSSPGSSFAPGFLRRHSTSNLQALASGPKFPSATGSSSSSTSSSSSSSSSSFGSLKETGSGGGGGSSSPTALLNKENKFRDRSFSENGERSQHLMQQLQQQQAAGKGGGSGGGGAPINSTRYKTELCRPFEESGACKYGEKCQFAHGFHELRSLTRHPKYKTELCRTFHTIGFCPYGPRCHFIHNAEERRAVAGGREPAVPDRPRLQHSFSFAGFPSAAASGLLDSPTSITPPPMLSADDLLGSPTLPDCASNPFTFSSQELVSLFTPSMGVQVPSGGSPTAFLFRPMSESPNMFDSPPSPQDSLSDQEGYLSSSSSSHSGSDSPVLDTSRRLPIFSRLSISDD